MGDGWGEILALIIHLVAIGLLSAVGWIHLHLWQLGYRHIPTIGPLFLAGAVTALVVAVGLLGRPSRLIALLGFGVTAGILAGLIASVNVGLFGFKESLSAPFAVESILLEIAAAITLAGWIAVDRMEESRQIGRNPFNYQMAGFGPPAGPSNTEGIQVHVHPAAHE